MKRLLVVMLLLFSISGILQAREDRVIVGIHARFNPTERINNNGDLTIWFTVLWYDVEAKEYTATICIVRDPALFQKALRLATKFSKEPFSQIVRVKGKRISRYKGVWERIVVKDINWLK